MPELAFTSNPDDDPWSEYPAIESIPLDKIKISPRYQRRLRETWVDDLVKNWDFTKYEPLSLNLRANGWYYGMAGQHRLEAMRRLGFTHARCVVWKELTTRTEAAVFSSSNNARIRNSGYENFRAKLEARDPIAVEIDTVTRALGWRLSQSTMPNCIKAVVTLERIHRRGGIEAIERVLNVIYKAYEHNEIRATEGEFMEGISMFIEKYQDDPAYKESSLVRTLKEATAGGIMQQSALTRKAFGGRSPNHVRDAVLHYYNRRRQEKNRLGD